MVEQLIRNQQVVSSSLTVGSRFKQKTRWMKAWPLDHERPFLLSSVVTGDSAAKPKKIWGLCTECAEAPVCERPSGPAYSTVTVKVEVDFTDPDEPASPAAGVAVMVAVDVTGLVVVVLEVPPQPETKAKPAKRTNTSMSM